MPVQADIALQTQRPKIMSPGDLLSLKDLSTRAQLNEFNLQQAKETAPLKMKLAEIGMLKDQQALEEELIKRREALSKEVNEYAYNKALQVKATGAGQDIIDQAVRAAYLEKINEQAASGKHRMAGIDDKMLDQARTKAPTFKDIEAKILTPQQALERADYQDTMPQQAQQVPLSQISQGPVIPPLGTEGDLLGNGPIRKEAEGPLETPEVTVTAKAPINSPEDLRREAQRLDSKGTKVASEKAEKLRADADRLDNLSLESQKLEDSQKNREEMRLQREQVEKARQEEAAAKKGQDYQKVAGQIRDDYSKASGSFVTIRDAYSRLKAATKTPSAAGDIALIFGYMRMLDPTSTVREGEFATAQNAAGIPDQVRNLWNKLLTGERLQDSQRKDFVGQAESIYSEAKANHKSIKSQYSDIAKRAQIDPKDAILDYDMVEKPGQGPRKEEPPKRRASDQFSEEEINAELKRRGLQ